jgi:hypothetical protein
MSLSKGWENEESFSFFVPVTALEVKKSGEGKESKRWIQGIASTNSRDLQGEIIEQNGIDFSYFLKHGYLNDDHKPGPEHKIGQPTECKVTKNGLWIKGFLFSNHKRADYYWELMNALSASGADRKVGFSIQGKVKRRNGKQITECWIQDIALTPSPVNTTTWADMAKSLSAAEWAFDKSVSELAGEDEEKALTAGGSPLVPESLEGGIKEDRTNKSLTYDETVAYLKSSHELNEEAAVAVANVVFELF